MFCEREKHRERDRQAYKTVSKLFYMPDRGRDEKKKKRIVLCGPWWGALFAWR
jgi:hypothetical protein